MTEVCPRLEHQRLHAGHAGVAFSIATSVAFSDVGLLMILLAWFLAALVAPSRVLLGIHNLKEIVTGGVVGIVTTLALQLAFH